MEQRIVFVQTLSPLHAGDGQGPGIVDLTIQREAHTGWPVVRGSSVKGALRPAVDAKNKEAAKRLFGDEGEGKNGASAHAGSLSIRDARLLLFPARSSRGGVVLLTCPLARDRFLRDCGVRELPAPDQPNPGHAIFSDDTAGELWIEEYKWTAKKGDTGLEGAPLPESPFPVALVNDTDFTRFARRATLVTTRVALNYETKRVEEGALFQEEFLPPESLLYCAVSASRARDDSGREPDAVLDLFCKTLFEENDHAALHLGGDTTTGSGLCRLSFNNLEVATHA